MRYLIATIVTMALCLPTQAEILIFKTATVGQQLDVSNKVVEKKKESGYLVINADLSNTNNITVSEAQYLIYGINAGMKAQNTTMPSDVQIIMVDSGKGKKMVLRCFDPTTGTYIVVTGNASSKDIGSGTPRYVASSLSGSSVWQQADFKTGYGSFKLALDLKATRTANAQSKTVVSVIGEYSTALSNKGYIGE